MTPVAQAALSKLLAQAESAWGRGSAGRRITLKFSEASLPAYLKLTSHEQRLECNADLMRSAQSGAVVIEWDPRAGERRQIVRLVLLDADKLASVLGTQPLWEQVQIAEAGLAPASATFPVVANVLAAWRRGVKVRGTRPTDWSMWSGAADVIKHCRRSGGEDLAIRRLSTALFADSKRIEVLAAAMDVLLVGDLAAPVRDDEEVFGELGLVKFPPTLLIAGDAVAQLGAQAVPLARPYLGLAPRAVDGFSDCATARTLLTIENLTTFHELCALSQPGDGQLLLYSAGMPSPSWLRVYGLLLQALPTTSRVLHWGDADAGGFRIAEYIAKAAALHGRRLDLYGMDGQLCDADRTPTIARRSLDDAEVDTICRTCAQRGWVAEGNWIRSVRLAVEQEAMHCRPLVVL